MGSHDLKLNMRVAGELAIGRRVCASQRKVLRPERCPGNTSGLRPFSQMAPNLVSISYLSNYGSGLLSRIEWQASRQSGVAPARDVKDICV